MKQSVAYMVCPDFQSEDGTNAYHQEDLPLLESLHSDEETAETAALGWLRDRRKIGDTRDWKVYLYPDPYVVAERRLNGGEWLGPVRILRSSQLPTLPKGEWRNRINRAVELLKWFKEIVRSAAVLEKVIEWLQEVIEWLLFYRDRSSNRRGGAIA